jgi:hypothetical protein
MKADIIVRFFNEHIYAEHFINYYLGLGFDHIHILFQKGQAFLSIMSKQVSIIYHEYAGNDVLQYIPSLVTTTADWILLCDADEYLYIKQYTTIKEFLKTIPATVEQLFFQWAMIENFADMTGQHDLFDTLTTHNMYINPHIKSMVRSSLLRKGDITPHVCENGVSNYLWNKFVNCSPKHDVTVESYNINYPFLIHFHTRSIQNALLKGISTKFNNNKKINIQLFNTILAGNNNNDATRSFAKLSIPFYHAKYPVLPIHVPINLKGYLINYDDEEKALKELCTQNGINYSSVKLLIKELSTKHANTFKKSVN